MEDKIYDSIIIGSGPAGLSASIYLARFNRSVLSIDKEDGRSTYQQVNENYLGFIDGIHATHLRDIGKRQAEKFGAEFIYGEVEDISNKDGTFEITGELFAYKSRTLIFATGVKDLFPEIKGIEEYIGKSLFWCITCDGCKTVGKKIIVVGKVMKPQQHVFSF
jgi:thioredoxin reductase (NADPH)